MQAAQRARGNRTVRGSAGVGGSGRSGRVRARVRALLWAAAWTAGLGIAAGAGLGLVGPFAGAAAAQTGAATASRSEPWSSRAVNVVVPQRRVIPVRPDVGAVKMSAVVSSVAVVDQVATTTLEITLANPNPRIMEAELVLPVPDGAAVKGFELDGLPNEGKARILPRDEARRIYESIVRQTRDPGLVEFIGSSLIRSSVFPVPANGTQKLRISYEQVLAADGPRVDYVLPRSDALAESGVEWSASMTISSSRPIATVYSPSHSLAVDRRGPGEVSLKVTGAMGSTPGSLRVSYLLDPAKDSLNNALSATVFTYPDLDMTGGGYFMLLAGLPSGVTAASVKTAKEVTLVIDRSGSMKGPKIEQAKKAALQVLEGLDAGDAFNLIDYSDSISAFSPRAVVKNAETMNSVRGYVGSIQANGGTNLHDALMESLTVPPLDAERLPMVLFLTDGLPTVGQTQEATIRTNAQKGNKFNRRVFTFGVGYDVNVPLLSGVALESRAASTFVLPDEDVEQKVSQVYRRLQGPVITSPALTAALAAAGSKSGGGPAVRELMPATMPDVFEGDQILVLGVYTGTAPIALTVTGTMGKEPIAYNVSLDPAAASLRHSFVPRLWANRRIGFLNDQITKLTAETGAINQNDPRMKELIEEIVRLSTKWGILTEYTAFLADDTTDRRAFSQPAAPEVREEAVRKMAPATGVRMSRWAMNQESNRAAPASSGGRQTTNLAAQNEWVDKDGERRSLNTVWQTADQTMFYRNNRWVDVRTLKQAEKADPSVFDRVVSFGSDEYFALAGELAAQGRQSLLSQSGEIEIFHEGKRVLVKP
jgi:Ca-activated chloride channel homolog